MWRVATVMALVLLFAACTDSATSLESGTSKTVESGNGGSTPTTASSLPGEDSMAEEGDGYGEELLGDTLSRSVFECPDGTSFQFEPHFDSRSTGANFFTLADGSELRAGNTWVQLEAGFIDTAPLEFLGKTALRVVDQATGSEQACPESDSTGSWATGDGPAQIETCAVAAPWGVMGGQQVTYLGERGNEGVVEIHRNGTLFAAMNVGLTWDDLLEIRQLETSDEELERTTNFLFGAPGEIFFSDFGSPAGELSYSFVVRDNDGIEIQRIDCGSVVVPSLGAVTCLLDLVDGFPRLTISDGAFPEEVRRNGVLLEPTLGFDGLVDTTAPSDIPLQYQVTVAAPIPGAPSQVVQCGSIEPQQVELQARLETLAEGTGPAHWYGEVTPICNDCAPTPLLLAWNATNLYRWEDGSFISVEQTTALWLRSPGAVPQLLLDFLKEGHDVEAEFDGRQLTAWTVDGEGAIYRCIEGDTAPIEIRATYHQQSLDKCQGEP